MTLYIAEHRAGPPRGRPRGLDHIEEFDELEDAKRACDRWQRSECKQSILDMSTGERWIRIDSDRVEPGPTGNPPLRVRPSSHRPPMSSPTLPGRRVMKRAVELFAFERWSVAFALRGRDVADTQ